MDIPMNAEVYCHKKPCGTSTYTVLNSDTEQVTHLVVKQSRAPHTERLVPIDLVVETTPHRIDLRCSGEQLAEMEPFFETDFVEVKVPRYTGPFLVGAYAIPDTERVRVRREHLPAGALAVHQGARVEATDGHVGQVDEFLIDPLDEHITHLVLREGHFWGRKDVTIPVSQIDRLEEETVYLKLDKRSIEALPSTPA
jgi:sporulation protein YlmC with PRC-barrel domain